MSDPIEPPAVDKRWDDTVEPVDGDWDRDFWIALARDVCGLDAAVLDDCPTEWIVGRVAEEKPRFYGGAAR